MMGGNPALTGYQANQHFMKQTAPGTFFENVIDTSINDNRISTITKFHLYRPTQKLGITLGNRSSTYIRVHKLCLHKTRVRIYHLQEAGKEELEKLH